MSPSSASHCHLRTGDLPCINCLQSFTPPGRCPPPSFYTKSLPSSSSVIYAQGSFRPSYHEGAAPVTQVDSELAGVSVVGKEER